jgi:glutamate dehydrogenase (NADP+)
VSGSGNVATHGAEKLHQMGGTVVACSDSDGYVYDAKGVDVDLLKQVKLGERGRIADYAERRGSAAADVEGPGIWDVPCQIAVPSATQNELTGRDAERLIRNGCIAVVEGANMPSTLDAVRLFQDAGVLFGPGKAANAGGVATSALEMQQNASRDSWTFQHTEARLAEIMRAIHDQCAATAEEYAAHGNYVAGANIAGFLKVGRTMIALGLI